MKKYFAIAGLVVLGLGISTAVYLASNKPQSAGEPLTSASTEATSSGISYIGMPNEVKSAKAVVQDLLNRDFSLSVISHAQLADTHFVSDLASQNSRKNSIASVWDTSAVETRFKSLQAAIEWGAANLNHPLMEATKFSVKNWNGVQVKGASIRAIVTGNQIETVSGKDRKMPEMQLDVRLAKNASGKWVLLSIHSHQVGSF